MKISNYLKKEFCVMELTATTKEQAIKEIAEQLFQVGKVSSLDKFISDILEREALGSTGIGHNIAIPHARTKAVKHFVIGFGKSKNGIDFKSIDDQKVNLIFLMGADPGDLNLYLRLLAELSKLLMNHSFRMELMSVQDPGQIVSVIEKFEQV